MNRQQKIETIFIGLALFATYFGAGNLIFPPILGLQSGTNWFLAILGLVLSGIFLPVIAMIVIGKCGSVNNITDHISKNFYNIIIGAIMFIVLFVANPRTSATAIEMGVQGIIPQIPYIPCIIIYFTLVYYFAKNKGSVFDKIGKILTPAMVIILLVLIFLGIVQPIGNPIYTELEKPFVNAFLTGYQTGDVLVSFLLASVFLGTIKSKGYVGKECDKVIIIASCIAFLGLVSVYGGLLFMGACGSGIFPQSIGRADLLVGITKKVGGSIAMIALGLAAILACLTTAVAQATAAGDYFVQLSKGRLNYKYTVAASCIVSMLIALIGVDKIVIFSNPIYATIYPVILTILILGVFNKVIPNNRSYQGAVIFTFIYSFCETLLTFNIHITFLEKLITIMPFSAQGLGWILPSIIGFILGTFLGSIKKNK